MQQIIITICDKQSGYTQDIEIPTDVPTAQLLDDITQALAGYEPSLYWNLAQIVLYSPRLGEKLSESKTLLETGIRNGDYLYITGK